MSGSGKDFEAEWSVAERGFKIATVNHATFFMYSRRYTAGGNPKGFLGIDAKQKSNLTGFITVKDHIVKAIDTPNGKVEFLELIGMTDSESKTLSDIGSVMEIYEKLGSDITDYNRNSII